MIARTAVLLDAARARLRRNDRAPLPGDGGLRIAAMVIVFVLISFGLALVWLVLGHSLGRDSSRAALLVGAAAAVAAGGAFGRKGLASTVALLALAYAVTAFVANWIVDISYDGQDYHYTAIWALTHGWSPFYESFDRFVAPGADNEIWATYFPKAHWLFNALQVSAGLSYEAAKTEPMLLAIASGGAVYGVVRRLGGAAGWAGFAAVVATLNPIVLQELFARMNDAIAAGLYVVFLAFGTLVAVKADRRGLVVCLAALVLALNTKQSAILILAVLSAWLVVLAWLQKGTRRAILLGGNIFAAALIGLFLVGADPYLRNLVRHGNPVYPLRGAPDIVIDDEFRPPALGDHSDPMRLAMSLAGRTSYEGPDYKLPFSVSREEFQLAGDPEVFLAGFGPWFSGVLLLACAAVASAGLARPGWRSPAAILGLSGMAIAISAFIMPENWAVRYVPQLWLVPLLFAAAAFAAPAGPVSRALAALTLAAMIGNVALVGGSVALRQGGGSVAIARQVARLRQQPAAFSADVGASPARLGLLEDHGLAVSVRTGEDPRCSARAEPLPHAYAYEDNGGRPATVCLLDT